METDAGVAYRLYRETGKIINLGDWWNAFDQSSVDESTTRQNKKKRKRLQGEEGDDDAVEEDGNIVEEHEDEAEGDAEERRKQARFIRAVGDLAHVGFLLPSTRKAEHVAKSVF